MRVCGGGGYRDTDAWMDPLAQTEPESQGVEKHAAFIPVQNPIPQPRSLFTAQTLPSLQGGDTPRCSTPFPRGPGGGMPGSPQLGRFLPRPGGGSSGVGDAAVRGAGLGSPRRSRLDWFRRVGAGLRPSPPGFTAFIAPSRQQGPGGCGGRVHLGPLLVPPPGSEPGGGQLCGAEPRDPASQITGDPPCSVRLSPGITGEPPCSGVPPQPTFGGAPSSAPLNLPQ